MAVEQKASGVVGAAPPESRLRGLLKKKPPSAEELQKNVDAARARLTAAQSVYHPFIKKTREEKAAAKQGLANAIYAQTAPTTGRNRDGSYIRPEFESLVDPTTGRLYDEYSVAKEFNPVTADSAGYDQYKTEAMRASGTPSAYAQMMLNKQGLEEQGQINKLAATQNAAQRGAMDDLAAQGGLSSGSRERIAKGGMRDLLMGRQDVRAQGMMDRFNISAQDEQNRLSQLQNLTGMELNRANFAASERDKGLAASTADINNSLSAMDRERADAMDEWKTNMQTWGANKTADAQAKAAKGGGK